LNNTSLDEWFSLRPPRLNSSLAEAVYKYLQGNANRCPGALVKDTKKENYMVFIALKSV